MSKTDEYEHCLSPCRDIYANYGRHEPNCRGDEIACIERDRDDAVTTAIEVGRELQAVKKRAEELEAFVKRFIDVITSVDPAAPRICNLADDAMKLVPERTTTGG